MNNNELNELSLFSFIGRNTVFNFMKTYSLSFLVENSTKSESFLSNSEGEPIAEASMESSLDEDDVEIAMDQLVADIVEGHQNSEDYQVN